jgi:hypothetical protein
MEFTWNLEFKILYRYVSSTVVEDKKLRLIDSIRFDSSDSILLVVTRVWFAIFVCLPEF